MLPMGSSRGFKLGLLAGQVLTAGLAQGVSLAVAAIRIPLLFRSYGPELVGGVAIAAALVPIGLVPAAGVRAARRLEATRADENTHLHDGPTPGLVCVLASLSLLATCLIPFSNVFGRSTPRPEAALALAVVAIGCLAGLAGAGSWGRLEAAGRFQELNICVAVMSAISLALTLCCLNVPNPLLVHTSISVLASCVPFLLAIVLEHRLLGVPKRHILALRCDGDRLAVAETWRAVPPLAVRVTDPLFVSALVSVSAAGEYAVMLRFALLATAPVVASGPFWAALINRRDTSSFLARKRMWQALLSNVVFSVSVAVAFAFMAPGIIRSLIGLEPSDALVRWLAFSMPIQAASGTITSVVLGQRASRSLAKVEVFSMAINLVLSFALTLRLGVSGPVVATCLSLTVLLCLQGFTIRRNEFGLLGRPPRSVS